MNEIRGIRFRPGIARGVIFTMLLVFGPAASAGMAPPLRLIAPSPDTILVDGAVRFSWSHETDGGEEALLVRRYEIVFWSETTTFSRSFEVVPDAGGNPSGKEFEECRDVFQRHGRYRWRVAAELFDGTRLVSEPREFRVVVPVSHEQFVPWLYPYAIQFGCVNRYGSEEYDAFLSGLSSSRSLDDFVSLGLVFHQNRLGLPTLELTERLLILSQVGLGVNVSTRFRLFRNLYFSMHPVLDVEYHWFSTGLEDYTSSLYSVKLGGDWMIMPKGTLTVRSSWVPVYRIRYAWSDDELRTWQGKGWELGARVIIPNHAIEPFRLLGMEIDFRRIPVEFHYSRIRDHYSDTLMRMGRVSVGYLLW